MRREQEILAKYLRQQGLRMTSERSALLEEIFRRHGHLDVEDLLRSLGDRGVKISRATVYRNLDLFERSGLVRKQRLDGRRFLYEHVHPGMRHDHLVCRECGLVVEFVSPGITALQGEICRAHDFVSGESTLKISGLCRVCARSSKRVAKERSGAEPTTRPTTSLLVAVALLVSLLAGGPSWATGASVAADSAADPAAPDEPPVTPPSPSTVFEALTVTGGAEGRRRAPGSVHYLGPEVLKEQSHDDIHRILRQVPGVNLQEEEGYGLRPNIGMRGTGVERSQKITLLEDGILIAPAPYAAPAAYYFPTVGRMEAVEVRKGSSSIRQGPYTNGGVLNLISTSIPTTALARADLTLGGDKTVKAHASLGGSGERWGWLLEGYRFETDGFKELDGGGETGVTLQDWVAKGRLQSGSEARAYQALEIKLGVTDQAGDETYLGLTRDDFDRTPYRRYAGSQVDAIDTDHEQVQLRWFVQPAPRFDLTTTTYRNDFFRNWYKLQSVRDTGLGTVLDEPVEYPEALAILRGEVDASAGPLAVRANRRDYFGRGLQSVAGLGFRLGATDHRLEAGLRYHEDEEDRFQEDDLWNMVAGRMALESRGAPGSQTNRVSDAAAWAFFVQDSIRFERLTVTPGVRFESIDYHRRDFGGSDPGRVGDHLVQRSSGVEELIPGLGVSYAPADRWTVFAGIHKGFSPPGPGQDDGTRAEESWNHEAGVRFVGPGLDAELVGFFNDYDNLLGQDTLSSGGTGTGDVFNGGAVEVSGLELGLGTDLGRRLGWRLGVPLRLAWTWTRSEFRTSFETDFADWAPAVRGGDELPYLPEHQGSLSTGLVGETWDLRLSIQHVDEMRTKPGRGPIGPGEGTDRATIVDLSASYRLLRGLRLELHIRNLSDEVYVAARRPAGARPGLPRTLSVGVSWEG